MNIWRNWQGFSFMMGVCFIIIGGLNIVVLRQVLSDAFPPFELTIIMMVLLGSVVYSGLHFFTKVQFYGALFGLTLLSIGLVLHCL